MLKTFDIFWFQKESNMNIKVFKLLFIPLVLVFYTLRAFDFLFLYSKDFSILENADIHLFVPSEVNSWLLDLVPVTYFGHFMFFIFLFVFLIVGLLGFLPRIFYLIPLLIHTILCLRAPVIVYGADSLIALGLFFLTLSDFKTLLLTNIGSSLSSVGFRLMQIQVSIIYFSAALEKIKSDSWYGGEALWHVFNNKQMMLFNLTSFLNSSFIISSLTWSVIFLEFFLSFGLWWSKTRKISLAVGFFFHLVIALLMGLWFFSLFMLCFYILFLDKSFLKKITHQQLGSNK